jgi:hypothetical protein
MNTRNTLIALSLLCWGALSIPAAADDGFPRPATFTTLVTTDFNIEGLTGDDRGNLYTPTRPTGGDCPVLRFDSTIETRRRWKWVAFPRRARPWALLSVTTAGST